MKYGGTHDGRGTPRTIYHSLPLEKGINIDTVSSRLLHRADT